MKKTEAIELLGGTVKAAAAAIGISYEAVYKWPDPLTSRIADRVHAALARAHSTRRRTSSVKAQKETEALTA